MNLKAKFKCLILFQLSLCSTFHASAEEFNIDNPLSLNQALVLAVQSHPLVASAKSQYRAAKSDLSSSRWGRFPTVAAGSQESTDNVIQDTSTVTMPLWMGGKINADIELAKSRRDGALSGVSEAQQTVLLESIGSFFDYFKAEKKLTIANQNVDEHQRLYEIIQRRVAAATSPDVDTMLALARLQYARSAQIQSVSTRSITKSALELLIGMPVNAVLVASDTAPLDISINAAVSKGISTSPKIARVKFEADGFDANVKLARSALFPQVSLGYEYGKTEGGALDGQLTEESFVSIQFQPGAGLSVASSVSAAKQRKQSALDTLEAEKRELKGQIKAAWNEYSSVTFQLEPSKKLVEATNSVVESYLRQYAVGKKSWLDVLNAQREATQARNTLVDYEVLYLTSLYRLRVLLNEINPNLLGV
ncbi:MAG: TolC family protein [Porticoccaceae bacterium]|nr:TolC family protein [Porticoccaceae bacterium]